MVVRADCRGAGDHRDDGPLARLQGAAVSPQGASSVPRFAAVMKCTEAQVWLRIRSFQKPRVEPSKTPVIAQGHQLWIGPEDRPAVLRVARHDVRLAETTDPARQLDVLSDLADDLKDEAIRLTRAGKHGNLP